MQIFDKIIMPKIGLKNLSNFKNTSRNVILLVITLDNNNINIILLLLFMILGRCYGCSSKYSYF